LPPFGGARFPLYLGHKFVTDPMTWLLQHDTDVLVWQDFDTEAEAREWADDNILRDDRRNWTLIDPEGGDWMV